MLGKLGGRKFLVTLLGNIVVLFMDINEADKAQLLAAINSVYVGVQGIADSVTKGKTSSGAGK